MFLQRVPLMTFNTFLFMFLSVYSAGNAQNILRRFDDVHIEHYGPDPCKSFKPKMPDFRAPGRRISEVKCFEYVWLAKIEMQKEQQFIDCSALHSTFPVLGGRAAELGEYAHVGALGWLGISGDWVFKCGASLISEKYALTAAHCSKLRRIDTDVSDLVPRIVRLGADPITNLDRYKMPATDARIKQIILHPQYNSPRQYYDIALILFEEDVKFDKLVHPACLEGTFHDPKKANVAGWGVVNLATLKTSPSLQVAQVSLVDSQTCDYLLRFKFNRNWRGTAPHQLCAGHLAGGIDSCQGDSGGPLSQIIINNQYKRNPIRWTVHRITGVTSFGYGCGRANTPGVYTRVASFIDWIESIVWPLNYNF